MTDGIYDSILTNLRSCLSNFKFADMMEDLKWKCISVSPPPNCCMWDVEFISVQFRCRITKGPSYYVPFPWWCTLKVRFLLLLMIKAIYWIFHRRTVPLFHFILFEDGFVMYQFRITRGINHMLFMSLVLLNYFVEFNIIRAKYDVRKIVYEIKRISTTSWTRYLFPLFSYNLMCIRISGDFYDK